MEKSRAIKVLKPLATSFVDYANITMKEEDDDTAEALEMAIEALKAQLSQEGTTKDAISRQAALEKVRAMQTYKLFDDIILVDKATVQTELMMLPSLPTEPQWIPVSERLPEDLEEVNVTWVNRNPESYYESIKDKPFTATAVYYKGKWYWWSTYTQDLLAEYGERCNVGLLHEAIEITAWMPLPEPYQKGATP